MRALCGAIIAAGALVCLGLTAIGVGTRYQIHPYHNQAGEPQWVHFKYLDTTLMIIVVASLIAVGIGLAIAFFGLAYHHHRRHHEMMHYESMRRDRGTPVA